MAAAPFRVKSERRAAGDIGLPHGAVVAERHQHKQFVLEAARHLHAVRHRRRCAGIEHHQIGEGAAHDRADLGLQAERRRIAPSHQIERGERRQILAAQLHHLVGLGRRAQHRIGGAAADVGCQRDAHAGSGEPLVVEQAAADEQIRCRAEHRDRPGVAQQRDLGVLEMNAVSHQRARAEEAEAVIDRGVAGVVGEQPLDRGDLVEVLVEVGLHQDGRKFLQQRAELGELGFGRRDGKARGDGVALPAVAVPALDEIAAVGDRGRRRRQQARRTVAVHDRVAGDHALIALVGRGEQGFGRGRMRAAIRDRRGGAVAGELVEKERGVARRMGWIGEFLLLDESVLLQPLQELRAVGGDHLGLRKMNVRVDEARHDQRVGVAVDGDAGRKLRQQRRGIADRFDPAVTHDDETVVDVAVAVGVAGAARRAREGQQPAADGACRLVGRLAHCRCPPAITAPARRRQATTPERAARRRSFR